MKASLGTTTTTSTATQVDIPKSKMVSKGTITAAQPTKSPISDFLLETEARVVFYTGLKLHERQCLWDFLGPAKSELEIIGFKPKKTSGELRSLSVQCQFLLCLMILRRNKSFKEIHVAYRISGDTLVGKVFRTWIQFLYFKFRDIKDIMFIPKKDLPKPLPRHFNNKLLRDVRVIIDGTELKAQSSTNYKQQGNMFSSYKHHTTLKLLIGVSPSGMGMFISDAFEGSISDREIVLQSGFLEYIDPGDCVLADRGFTIEDLLLEREAKLIIPPFLSGRTVFTEEEVQRTRVIAKARSHIERYNWRFKKFEFLKGVIPHYHFPYISQAVYICACLANFSLPLAK